MTWVRLGTAHFPGPITTQGSHKDSPALVLLSQNYWVSLLGFLGDVDKEV